MNDMLKNLSDDELLEYYKLYSELSPRETDRYITGVDHKKMYHVARLLLQAEQAMTTGTLDLEANKELLKAIRRGEWTLDQLKDWFHKRERELETLYIDSELPYTADMVKLKELLMQCLEVKFGSIDSYFNVDGSTKVMSKKLSRIRAILDE